MDLVLRDPMEYVRCYIQQQGRYESEAMMFGKRFAKAMEDGESPDDANLDFLVKMGVPSFELREKEIKAKYKGIPILGKMDSITKDLTKFRDTKTGMSEWNDTKVNSHEQFLFYALLIMLKTGKLPRECWVDWVETKYDEETGDITPSGKIKSIKRKEFGLVEITQLGKRIILAAETITELMNDWSPKK